MGVYLPYGFEPLTALHIVDRYSEIIDDLNKEYYNDYEDHLTFDSGNPNVFHLKYLPPTSNAIRLYINGVFYNIEDDYFDFDREKREITWKFERKFGGFDLEPHWKFLALYDVYYEMNGLSGSKDIK
jgi:hypothetical protein